MKNSFEVSGNVGNVEIKNVAGKEVINFSVAENRRKFNKQTNQMEDGETFWWDVDLWLNGDADYAKYAKHVIVKGKPVHVTGSLAYREADGKRYYTVAASKVYPNPTNSK